MVKTIDKHELGYVAIGEAVLRHITSNKEISRESLMMMLTQHAEEVTNEYQLSQIWLGHSLLKNARHDHSSLTEN
ncbi:hypothetical protein POH93_06460 [Phytobacter diazotrophicus]|uniref:hypothetical protein n=1 Tax=Phytobacter diazotrophicus TaxID=395631 RepID=UPI00232ED437|nr:hypothetical protein [Phytobacter diazotrophicus]MDC0725031.1 hypothetical protein [Phytobacter diazotrophicus]MDC0732575.1 hypothetical protein [Phytobacter diazotrophicus]